MTLRYQHLQCKLKVLPQGTLTLALTNDLVQALSFEDAPYAHGIKRVWISISNASLTGDLTITIVASALTTGLGSQTTLQTWTMTSTDTDAQIEIPAEVISHASDRAGSAFVPFKSLAVKASGTATDTFDAVIVVECLEEREDLNDHSSGVTVA